MSDERKLLVQLKNSKPSTRYKACEELRVSREISPEALAALQAAMNDTDADVADAAKRAYDIHTPTRPTQATKPSGSEPRRARELIPLAAVVVALGWASKLYTAGWLTLLLGIAYLAVGVIHFVVHFRAIAKGPDDTRALVDWILASHTFFVLGFLLQIDGGDGPSWMTIYYIVGGGYRAGYPSWWPGIWMNIVVFAPLVWTWVRLLSKSHSPSD